MKKMKTFVRKTCSILLALALAFLQLAQGVFAAVDSFYIYENLGESADYGEYRQALYDRFYAAAAAKESPVIFTSPDWPYALPTSDDCREIYLNSVLNDHPELFWCKNVFSYSSTGSVFIFYPQYDLTSDEYAEQFWNSANELYSMARITSSMTEFEKALALYDVICDTFEYNLNAEHNQSAYSGIVNRSTVCAGYAKSYVVLLHMAGIEASTITGNADAGSGQERHEWIFLKIDGEYYYSDITWDDQLYRLYRYFHLTSEGIGADHFPDEFYWTPPVAVYDSASYYKATGGIMSGESPDFDWIVNRLCTNCGNAVIKLDSGTINDFYNWFVIGTVEYDGTSMTPQNALAAATGHAGVVPTFFDGIVLLNVSGEHTFSEKVPTERYLASAGGGEVPATYYYSCKCGECGTETFEMAPAHVHDFSVMNTDPEYLASAATCINLATYYYSCACGQAGTETFESGEYAAHTPATLEAVAPTCTETGLTEGSACSVCGEILVAQQVIEASGHDFGEWILTTDPGCVTPGEETRYCENCDEYETRGVAPTGHTSVTDEATDPTCTESGLTEGSHCSVCGEILVAQQTIEATGHEFGEWTLTTEPGCVTPGEETRYCANCDETDTREVDPVGHEFGDWILTTEPDCTTAGEETRYCANCDETETRVVDPLGHEFGDWIITTEPGCTTAGEETRYCDNCDETETRVVDPLGHNYVSVITLPTEETQGYTTHTCARCLDSYVDSYTGPLSEIGSVTLSGDAVFAAPAYEFDYAIKAAQVEGTGAAFTLMIDTSIASVLGVEAAEGVTVNYQADSVSVSFDREAEEGETLLTLRLRTHGRLEAGEYDPIEAVGAEAEFGKLTTYDWGDVNRDGRVNSRDAVIIQQYAVRMITFDEIQSALADVYSDGRINSRDAVLIQQYAVRLPVTLGAE